MASGRLGKGVAGAASHTTIYTAPGAIQYATVNITLCNTTAATRLFRLAISTTASPGASDWIDYEFQLDPGTTRERTAIVVSPGEMVIAYADATGVVVRVHGHEKT